MSYFTAVVARDGRAWRARDVDVEDAESLGELAELMRGVAHGEQPVIAVVEHEDEWFALVRVDGDEDPRVFVSDLPASSRGPYGDLLAPAAEVETSDGVAGGAGDRVEGADAGGPPDGGTDADVDADDVDPDDVDADDLDPDDVDAGVVAPDPGTPFSPDADDVAEATAGDDLDDEGGVAGLDALLDDADADGLVPDVDDLDEPDPLPVPAWAGDAGLLEDLGVGRRRLCTLTEDNTDDPAAVLAEVGEQVGFAELLEALR